MNNIYDLFNERKSCIDALVEGVQFEDEVEVEVEEAYDYSDIEPFESIEEALETLDEVLTESKNELIELRAAQYLEDLVLENMMFNDFEEEKMRGLIEAAEGGKKEAFIKRINALWERIKAWFEATIKSIRNHFIGGGKLVAENDSRIFSAMKMCDVKVKINNWKPLPSALGGLKAMIEKLKRENAKTNDEALGIIGAKDLADVNNVVKKLFVDGEAKEMEISDIPVDLAKAYAAGEKTIIGNLENIKMAFNKQFMECLNLLKAEKASDEMIAVFNFKITIQSKAMSAAIQCAKKASSDYTKVIRRALTSKPKGGDDEEGEEKPKKEKKVKEKKEKPEKEQKEKKEKKSFKDIFGKKDKKKEEKAEEEK